MIPLPAEVLHLYISPGHNYFGHHGGPAGDYPTLEVAEVSCVAGRGLKGDRFFGYRDGYPGQVTFFSQEVFEALCEAIGVYDKDPSVLRRNIVIRGVDLNEWIGREFDLQGIRFRGVEESKPCYWMETALGPGANAAMRGRGGLRAEVLTDGVLKRSVLAVA